MSIKIDKSLILNEIKLHYGMKKDVDFAIFLGISQSTLSSWHSRQTFDAELIIAKCEDIDANWLLTGKGSMLKDQPTVHSVSEPQALYGNKADRNLESQRIPLYSVEAAAGIVQLFQDTKPTKEFIMIPNLPKCDGAVPINGDSMYPLLKSGDIVMYKQVHDIVNYTYIWGQMYLINFVTDGEDYTTVKYIQKSTDLKMIVLVSQNENHQSIEIDKTRIRALALIKGSIRINTMN